MTIEISSENEKDRLDHFLCQRYPDLSRSYLQKQIEKKKILLNQKPTRKGQLLKLGDQIQILELLELLERKPSPNPNLKINIVFEDDVLAVIEKPAGIPTHPVNHEETKTIANWWIARNPEVLDTALDPLRPGIVHRLDTDTSGLLILATSQMWVDQLQSQFRKRTIQKEYLAFVHGQPPEKGRIDFPLAHDPKSKRRMKAITKNRELGKWKEKPAKTDFWVKEKFANFSVLRVKIYTGRMHQIRVHLDAIGYPILGDKIYGKSTPKAISKKIGRHCLHASFLSFCHPKEKRTMEFSSQIPKDLKEILHTLK